MLRKEKKEYTTHSDHSNLALFYEFEDHIDKKIAAIWLEIIKNRKGEFLRICVSSNSSNQKIYDDFIRFREEHKFKNYFSDLGKDSDISLYSNDIINPEEADIFINAVNGYETLPNEMYQQLRVACGLLPITNLEQIKSDIIHTIKLSKFDEAINISQLVQANLVESVRPHISNALSIDDKDEITFFLAKQFHKLAFGDFENLEELEFSLGTGNHECFFLQHFQRAIDCYQEIPEQSNRYKEAQLQCATLLDYYLKNGVHSEQEINSLKRQVIGHAINTGDFRFVYSLLNSYTGRNTITSCSLQNDASLIDLLFVIAEEGNNALMQSSNINREKKS